MNRLFVLLFSITLLFPALVFAEGKIGFVDVEIIIEQSRAIRMGMDAMDKEMAGMARKIDAEERSFRQKRYDLDRQERILSNDERTKRREELAQIQEKIEELKFEFDQQLRIRERQIEPVLELIMNKVADVAEEQGYDIVLRGEVVIYGKNTVDLTDDVTKELDENVSEVLNLFKDQELLTPDSEADETELPQEAEPEDSEASDTEDNTTADDELLPLIP